MENDIIKQKVIFRENLSVEIYVREESGSWLHVRKPKNINDINKILYLTSQIEW